MGCRGVAKRAGCLAGLVVLLSFSSEPLSAGQKAKGQAAEQETPPTQGLFPVETIPFPAPPPLLVESGMKCDPNGNIYLVYSDAPQAVLSQRDGVFRLPVQKLSIDRKTTVQFPIPFLADYQNLARLDFDVDARDNSVYALLTTRYQPDQKDKDEPAPQLIVKYKDDGTVDSFVKIGKIPGQEIVPQLFAVFRDGTFLVTGTARGSGEGGGFTAVFDRSGAFATNVKVPDDVGASPLNPAPESVSDAVAQGAAPASPAQEPGEARLRTRTGGPKIPPTIAIGSGSAVSAPDGNIYLLRATDHPRVYVVSPAGEVVRQFEVKPPGPGLTPFQMGMAGDDRIFVQFSHLIARGEGEDKSGSGHITVLDPNTGKATATYRLAAPESGSILSACASSAYSFLFVGTTEDNKLKVVRYSPRTY